MTKMCEGLLDFDFFFFNNILRSVMHSNHDLLGCNGTATVLLEAPSFDQKEMIRALSLCPVLA